MKQESSWPWQFLGDLGLKTVGKRCCQNIPPSYQSHWPVSASCAFLLMTIFFAKNWDMWSDRPEYLKLTVLEAWTLCCTTFPHPAHLLHIILSIGLQLLVPSFSCLPGSIEGKLEKAQNPYTSFLLIKGSLSQAVSWGGSRTLVAKVLKCSSEPGCFFSLSLLFVTSSWTGCSSSSHSSQPESCTGLYFLFLKHCLPEVGLGPNQEPLTAALSYSSCIHSSVGWGRQQA